MRLDKFICKSTELDKQQALLVLQSKQVSVNGELIIDPAFQVHENNQITLNDQVLIPRPFRHIIMHKPAGMVCSNVDEVYPAAFNLLIPENEAINDASLVSVTQVLNSDDFHIAGRLDADTTGLILITDDGRWTYNITRPNNECEKVYRVSLSKPINDDLAVKFAQGIQLQGETKLTLPAMVDMINSREVLLTITEGKFHQVKRMFSAVGNRVIRLHREQIGNIKLDVEEGKWRYLTPLEVGFFKG
jgi:16S rRNA pseudouridine516 synthase